jgi:hypothetical protein
MRRGGRGDNEEGCPFEQDGLGGAAGLGERRQVLGQDGRVEREEGRAREKARNAREAKYRRVAYSVSSWMLEPNTVTGTALLSASSSHERHSGSDALSPPAT